MSDRLLWIEDDTKDLDITCTLHWRYSKIGITATVLESLMSVLTSVLVGSSVDWKPCCRIIIGSLSTVTGEPCYCHGLYKNKLALSSVHLHLNYNKLVYINIIYILVHNIFCCVEIFIHCITLKDTTVKKYWSVKIKKIYHYFLKHIAKGHQ